VARSLVEWTCDQSALGYLDFVEGAVGHGKKGCAAIERVNPRYPRVVATDQIPWVDALGRIQVVDGPRLGALILDARISAADPLQAIRRIEPDHIGKSMPLEQPSIHLPLIAAQIESRAFAAGVGQYCAELTLPGTAQLQLARRLFVAQALVSKQIRGDQSRA